MENPNEAITKGKRRPFSSENGAQKMGPVANPRTYNDVPSVATTDPTLNFCSIAPVAALKIELPNAELSVVKPKIAAVISFFLVGQFCA